MSEKVDLVRSIYEAWARRDYRWVDWADPGIEFVIADGPSPGCYTGLAGMWEGWQDVLSPWQDWRAEELDVRDLDDERVLALFKFSGRGKTSGLEVASVAGRGANIFEFRDGTVVRIRAYWDRDHALTDLGLGE